jgi:hypothetical protein
LLLPAISLTADRTSSFQGDSSAARAGVPIWTVIAHETNAAQNDL